MPNSLGGHGMISIGYDLLVIGGYHTLSVNPPKGIVLGSIYKLSCSNDECKWDKLTKELKTPSVYLTAIPLPDDFIECT